MLGCDMTELDVHLCGSDELVVIHDESVDRTTDGSGLVSELSLDELRLLDAGKGERVPLLDEVLSLLKGLIGLNVELKGLGTAKPVYKLVESLGWRGDDLLITSFNWGMLKEYRVLDSNALIGPLTFNNLPEALLFAEEIDAYCINPFHGSLDQDYLDIVTIAHFNGIMWKKKGKNVEIMWKSTP